MHAAYRLLALRTETVPALKTSDLELIAVVDEAIRALQKRVSERDK